MHFSLPWIGLAALAAGPGLGGVPQTDSGAAADLDRPATQTRLPADEVAKRISGKFIRRTLLPEDEGPTSFSNSDKLKASEIARRISGKSFLPRRSAGYIDPVGVGETFLENGKWIGSSQSRILLRYDGRWTVRDGEICLIIEIPDPKEIGLDKSFCRTVTFIDDVVVIRDFRNMRGRIVRLQLSPSIINGG